MGYAFISYSSHNQSAADAIRRLLQSNGVRTWMAPYDIPAGSEYAEVLYDALTGCACLVLLLTGDSQNSLWVKKEVNIAISNCKTVIPVKLEDVELNSAMKLYLNDQQIVPVHTLDEDSEDIQKVLVSVVAMAGKELPEAAKPACKPELTEAAPQAAAQPAPAATQIRQLFPDGMYEGDCVNGQRTGKGKFTWNTGDVYEGDFLDGRRHGKGKYTWARGTVYEGDFWNGQRTGKGKFTRPNGEMYEGDFVNGKQHGMGKLHHVALTTNDTSCVYEGPFVDGKATGKGKITYASGNVYEGDVVDGKRQGSGVYTWNAPAPTVVKIQWVPMTPGAQPQWLGGQRQWDTGYVYRGTFEQDHVQNGKVYDAKGTLKITYVNGQPHYEE